MENELKFNLFEFQKQFNKNVLILYKGPFDKTVLSVFRSYIDGILIKLPRLNKKVFTVFIELAQNIIYYSAEKDKIDNKSIGVGTMAISEKKDSYTFYAGNSVDNENIGKFIERCSSIKNLDKEGLRKYKRDQLNLPSGPNDTANIGLIQIALTAEGKLDFELTKIDDNYSFIAITVEVLKNGIY